MSAWQGARKHAFRSGAVAKNHNLIIGRETEMPRQKETGHEFWNLKAHAQ